MALLSCIEQRTLNQCRLGQCCRCGGLVVHGVTCTGIQRSPAGAATIDHCFPAQFLDPGLQCALFQTVIAKIVISILYTVRVQPLARFFHCVAVLDTVKSDHSKTPEKPAFHNGNEDSKYRLPVTAAGSVGERIDGRTTATVQVVARPFWSSLVIYDSGSTPGICRSPAHRNRVPCRIRDRRK